MSNGHVTLLKVVPFLFPFCFNSLPNSSDQHLCFLFLTQMAHYELSLNVLFDTIIPSGDRIQRLWDHMEANNLVLVLKTDHLLEETSSSFPITYHRHKHTHIHTHSHFNSETEMTGYTKHQISVLNLKCHMSWVEVDSLWMVCSGHTL